MSALTELIAIEEEDRLTAAENRAERRLNRADHRKRLHMDPATMPRDTGRSADWHRHQCPNCRHVWAHDGAFLATLSDALFHLAHVCPKCKMFSEAATWCMDPKVQP